MERATDQTHHAFTRALPPEAADLPAVIEDVRRAAETAARLCDTLQTCLDRIACALETRDAVDVLPAPGPKPPAIQLVGHAVTPRRLVGLVTLHGFQVDPGRHTVQLGQKQALLTPNEWQLFALMLAEPGRTFTRDELARGAWGHGYGGRNSEVEVYISRLRRKLESDPRSPLMIETVRGSGYRLVPPDDAAIDEDGAVAG